MAKEAVGVAELLRSAPSLALFSRHNGRFLRRSRNFLAFYDGVKANHDHGSRDSLTSRRELWKLVWVDDDSFFVRSADQENSYWTVMRNAATNVSTVVLIAYDDVEKATPARPISALGKTCDKELEVPVCREHGPAMHPALFRLVLDGDAVALKHIKSDMWASVTGDDSVNLLEDYTPACQLSPALKVGLCQAQAPTAAPEAEAAGSEADGKAGVLHLNAGWRDRLAWSAPKLASMLLLHRSHCCVIAGSGRWWKLHDTDGHLGHAAKSLQDALRIRFTCVTSASGFMGSLPDVKDRQAVYQLLACSRIPGPSLIEPDKAEEYQLLVEDAHLLLASAGDGTEMPAHCTVELLPDVDFVRQKDFPLVVKLSRFTRRIQEEEAEVARPKPPLMLKREQGLLFNVPLKELVEKEAAAKQQADGQAAGPAVPRFVIDAVRFLLAEGRTSAEGLFRVSGRKTCVDKMLPFLEQLVDLEKVILLIESDEEQPMFVGEHEVAALLKQFLREMPEGLFTDALFADFMAVPEMAADGELLLVQDDYANAPSNHHHDEEEEEQEEGEGEGGEEREVDAKFCLTAYTAEKRSRYLELLSRRLPKCNHDTLKALCFLLHRVMRDGRNKMTATSLAIVMAPNVLRPAASAEPSASSDPLAALQAMKDNAGSFEVLRACIADYEALFQGGSSSPPVLFADLVCP